MHRLTSLLFLLSLPLAACHSTVDPTETETGTTTGDTPTGGTTRTTSDLGETTTETTAETVAETETVTTTRYETASTEGGSGCGSGGGSDDTSGTSSGETSTGGDECPPCPGPRECAKHVTPDGICEDLCDVLDLVCESAGLTAADCGLAHWFCSQGEDPCEFVADKGNDEAGHLCGCAMACDFPAPLLL